MVRRGQQQLFFLSLVAFSSSCGVSSHRWGHGVGLSERVGAVGFVTPLHGPVRHWQQPVQPKEEGVPRRLARRFVANKDETPSSSSSSLRIDPSLSEDDLAEALKDLYAADPAKFQRVVAQVEVDGRSTKPKFPPIDLSSVPPVPPNEVEAFRAKYISKEYLDYDDPQAQDRLKNARGLQYTRWKWACENLPTYVNMLRVAGHSDESIRNMLDGTPMCFASPDAYAELRAGLKQLAADIEAELGWTNCNFVITGSSVPGFSQNPIKGLADVPSKITSATTSDVDICIVGDGIDRTMTRRLEKGMAEPALCFPTTCSATTSATRFGCRDLSLLSKAVYDFAETWTPKLAGGLQFTFCEDDNATPPWEARIDIDNV